jgi:predicted permease
VKDVSLINRAGLDFDGTRRSVHIEGYTPQPAEDMEQAFNLAGPKYFRTMQMPLVAGRDFTDTDVRGRPGVLIVNETLARRYFPGQDALHKRISVTGSQGPFLEIVGVARDGKYWSLFEEPRAFMTLPLLQHYSDVATFVLRTDTEPTSLIGSVRGEVLAPDRDLLILDITTMTEYISASLLPMRIASLTASIFGGLALLLSGLGIYGLIAYFTGQRTREIGIRLALGAQRKDILRLVLNQGVTIAVIGIGLGILGALAMSRLLTSFIFGIGAIDAVTFATVAISLGIVAMVACWVPARRATRIDPMSALRYD